MKNALYTFALAAFAATMLLSSCKKDDPDKPDDVVVKEIIGTGTYFGTYEFPSGKSYEDNLTVTATQLKCERGLGIFTYTDNNDGSFDTPDGYGNYTPQSIKYYHETDSGNVVFNGDYVD